MQIAFIIIPLVFTSCFIQAQPVFREKLLQLSGQKPVICGHRGGWYDSIPENSRGVFEYSHSRSCSIPMLELDVRESKDGTLFVMHDETVDRTTSGSGTISALSDVHLKSLFLKNKKGEITSQKIPLFKEVLDWAKKEDAYLMIDMKSPNVKKIIDLLRQTDMIYNCVILTFKPEISLKVYISDTEAIISVLIKDEKDWEAIQKTNIPLKYLIAYISESTPDSLIKELHFLKIPVMTDVSEYTKNASKPLSSVFYQNLVKTKQLDLLITDFPVEVADIFCDKP